MNILLLEDEEPAALRLQKMLKEIEPGAVMPESIVSVSSAIQWLQHNPLPDLIISDIQLADGLSFEIFKEVKTLCPVIFTTAFDQYAIEAFKVNSIDYLLKPVKKEELLAAIEKYRNLSPQKQAAVPDINKLIEAMAAGGQPKYKKRFAVKYGEHLRTIGVEEAAYFYTEDKINFLTTKEGRRYTVDYNLDTLETMLDPHVFFRINRQYIISIQAIAEMFTYSKSRVLVKLNPPAKHETIVSTERSGDFKLWLGDN
ncbi:MAG TPA: LytTR family DNA-binding domain-containing protein [Ferruginibacter sp.]|nr:LytTR family DNA-binding domain-containing protein [Ferruginibacter sp.]